MEKLRRSGLGPVGAQPSLATPSSWGPVLPAFADVLEDADGVGFLVQLEDPLPESTRVVVRVLGDDREELLGEAPFADAEGRFGLQVPVKKGQASFFVAWGGLKAPPPTVHVVALFVDDQQTHGHTAFDLETKSGPPLTVASYIRPVAQMALAVAEADGVVQDEELASIRMQLETLFQLTEEEHADVKGLLEGPLPSLRRLSVSLWCRFPELDAEELFFALLGISASDGDVHAGELEVVAAIARHLEITEKAWRRWAFRMGVDLPSPDVSNQPSSQAVVRSEGRRLVPSVILRLDPQGQDRRNPLATLSLLTGIGTVGLMFLSFLSALTPISGWLLVLLLPTQFLLAAVAIGSGVMAWRKGAELEGAGQGAALTGIALGAVVLLILVVLMFAVCLGVGTQAIIEQYYQF